MNIIQAHTVDCLLRGAILGVCLILILILQNIFLVGCITIFTGWLGYVTYENFLSLGDGP